MSEVATPEPVQPAMNHKQRVDERKRLGPALRAAATTINTAVREFGQIARNVSENLFSAAEIKSGKLDAYMFTWTGYKPSTWKRYVQVASVLDQLAEQFDAATVEKVQTWPMDGVTLLSALDESERKDMIRQAGTNPSTKTLESVRDRVKPRRQRETPDAAAKTSKLAETIRERVAGIVGNDPTLYVPLITGAQIAQDHPGQDVAAAILFLSVNASAATPVVK